MSISAGGNVSDSVLITGSHNVVVLERAAAQARAAPRGRWGDGPWLARAPAPG